MRLRLTTTTTFTLVTVLFVSITAEVAHAERYLEPRISLGISELFNIEQVGIGTGTQIGGLLDGGLVEDDTEDVTAGIAIAAGWRTGGWSLETELGWRYRTDWDVAITTPSINSITNVQSNVGTTTLMVNAERRWQLNERWSLNIGMGAGLAHKHIDSDYVERAVPGVRGERKFNTSDSRLDLAVSGNVGLTRPIGERWRLSVRYRYIDFGDLEIDGWAERNARLRAGYTSHEVLVGFSRRL